jgi:hypothetical protein
MKDFPKDDTETISFSELSSPPTEKEPWVAVMKPRDFILPIAPTIAYLSVPGF